MLPVAEIIPFVRHADPLVQDLAIECLKRVQWPERITGDFLLDAIEAGHERLKRRLNRFVPTARVLNFTIREIKSRPYDKGIYWQLGLLEMAPDALFTPAVIDSIRALRMLADSSAKRIAGRLRVLNESTEVIRERILNACRKADERNLAGSQQAETHDLVRRLVERGDSLEWARARLDESRGADGWLEIWMVHFLGAARDRSILEMAFDRLATIDLDRNDALSSGFATVLSDLCVADDIPRLGSLWDASAEDNRTLLIESIGNLRLPAAEPLLVRCASESEDSQVKTFGAMAICDSLCTGDPARDFIRDLVDRGEYEGFIVDMNELAIPLGIITGRPFEEETRWRIRLLEAEKGRGKHLFGGSETNLDEMIEQLRISESDEQPVKPAVPISYDEPAVPIATQVAPLSRAGKVGRNDPCPCGSGKKYKKCCLGRDS